MAYINIQNVELNFGGTRLFDDIGLNVEQGERVVLVGRNGSGKSTLLRLIEGSVKPDAGNIAYPKRCRCAHLSQMVPQALPGTVLDVVSGDSRGNEDSEDKRQQVNIMISRLGLDAERFFNSLSAGLKRQVLLARALAGKRIYFCSTNRQTIWTSMR